MALKMRVYFIQVLENICNTFLWNFTRDHTLEFIINKINLFHREYSKLSINYEYWVRKMKPSYSRKFGNCDAERSKFNNVNPKMICTDVGWLQCRRSLIPGPALFFTQLRTRIKKIFCSQENNVEYN